MYGPNVLHRVAHHSHDRQAAALERRQHGRQHRLEHLGIGAEHDRDLLAALVVVRRIAEAVSDQMTHEHPHAFCMSVFGTVQCRIGNVNTDSADSLRRFRRCRQ